MSSIIDNVLNRDGNDEIKELFGYYPFSYPKPSKLIGQLVQCSTKKDSIVLDFFSGSATTAHAVMQLNAEDCGNRKYIMVQLNETVKKGSEAEKVGYKTIDEIGRERIRRAADKIRKEEPEKSKDIDLRFKTYRLESVDKNTLDKIVNFDPNFPIDTENIMSKFGKDTIIETWKIKDGYGFNTAPKEIDLAGYTAYLLDDGKHSSNLYLLDEMAEESIIELVRQMEAFQLKVDKIIEYGYSMTYSTNTSLRSNLKTLKNKNSIDVIIRY